jgi:NAD(P) transhydrogenase
MEATVMASADDEANGRYDVVVIGAGPAGEAAAELAGNLGYSVAIVERDTVGGTVVTSGGAPTKSFRDAALYLSSFDREKIYGVTLAAPPDVMYPAVRARARQVSEQLVQATMERIRASGAHLVVGEGRLDGDHTVAVRGADGGETRLRGWRVIIATGSRPLRPPTVPFDDPYVYDSETIADITRKPREMLIVGGGAIGVEYATIFSALGVPVTILDSAPRLAAMMDGEISARLKQVLLARGNRVIVGTGMVSARRTGDHLAVTLGNGRRLRPDALLFAAGRMVSTAGLGLEKAGVDVDGRGRIVVDSERRTSCPWVFAAGDVTRPGLASAAIDQGRQAVCAALGLDFSVHVDQIPTAAIYGLPEVARAGRSEDDCAAERIPYECGRCELGALPRGVIAGQEGLLKLVFHASTGVLLGVHAIGEDASEITGTGQAMLHNQATVENVLRMVYNTPTYTYGYKLAAGDALARLDPHVLRTMSLPSQAHRVLGDAGLGRLRRMGAVPPCHAGPDGEPYDRQRPATGLPAGRSVTRPLSHAPTERTSPAMDDACPLIHPVRVGARSHKTKHATRCKCRAARRRMAKGAGSCERSLQDAFSPAGWLFSAAR